MDRARRKCGRVERGDPFLGRVPGKVLPVTTGSVQTRFGLRLALMGGRQPSLSMAKGYTGATNSRNGSRTKRKTLLFLRQQLRSLQFVFPHIRQSWLPRGLANVFAAKVPLGQDEDRREDADAGQKNRRASILNLALKTVALASYINVIPLQQCAWLGYARKEVFVATRTAGVVPSGWLTDR